MQKNKKLTNKQKIYKKNRVKFKRELISIEYYLKLIDKKIMKILLLIFQNCS